MSHRQAMLHSRALKGTAWCTSAKPTSLVHASRSSLLWCALACTVQVASRLLPYMSCSTLLLVGSSG